MKTPRTRAEAEEMIRMLGKLQREVEAEDKARRSDIALAEARYRSLVAGKPEEIKEMLSRLRASPEKLVHKKDEATTLAALKALRTPTASFITVRESVNLPALLNGLRSSLGALLQSLPVKIEQYESFTVKPFPEET